MAAMVVVMTVSVAAVSAPPNKWVQDRFAISFCKSVFNHFTTTLPCVVANPAWLGYYRAKSSLQINVVRVRLGPLSCANVVVVCTLCRGGGALAETQHVGHFYEPSLQ